VYQKTIPFISSERHGFTFNPSNTYHWTDTSTLYKRISLEGDNYVFLCSETLDPDNRTLYGNNGIKFVKNIIEKIQLDGNPGTVVFHKNTFKPIVFRPQIRIEKSIDFQLYRYNGELFDILRLDYSFSIEIVQKKKALTRVLMRHE
jgi:hypothetical protein